MGEGHPNDTNLEGVTLFAINATSDLKPVVTDKEGFYIFKDVPYNWSGTIAPSKDGFAFQSLVPGSLGHNSIFYKPLEEDQKAQDYRMKPVVGSDDSALAPPGR